jgi:hypothetical protein
LHSSNTQSIFTAVIIVLALAMEGIGYLHMISPVPCAHLRALHAVHIAVVLSRNWRALSKLGNVAGMDFSTIIRVLLFGIYLLCCLLWVYLYLHGNPFG